MAPSQPIGDTPPLTDAEISAFEKEHSLNLPKDYREFLLLNNGVFPTPDCVEFEEAGRKTASDVFCFFALGDERAGLSMDWHIETYADRIPRDTVPVGRDSGGNLWLLSVRSSDAGSIFFWDHGSFDTFDETDLSNWPKIASSFHEFQELLAPYDATIENGGVPSRYSLVTQAADGMAEQDTTFRTRDNPDYVWHCDCDERGDVSMQFVQYEIHAVAAHTCGYSRLCAIMGLVKGGQTRFPE
ncbi:MAG: SMI1/KNR4 family protein [Planctomycetaceae bacterium]